MDMTGHQWELKEGVEREYFCGICKEELEIADGASPARLKRRGLVPPFDLCVPERQEINESFRQTVMWLNQFGAKGALVSR